MSLKYIPRMAELNVSGWETNKHGVDVLGFELPDGEVVSIDRPTFEFFFAPVLSTTADLSEEIG